MAKCYVCGEYFCGTNWSGPAEPCDCGSCVTITEFWDMQDRHPAQASEIADRKVRWNPTTLEFAAPIDADED
jgi:hypothetical protein